MAQTPDLREFSLIGQTALVTGGNAGIGLGLARGLARAGAAVAILGRRAEENAAAVADLRALGATAHAYEADLLDLAALPDLYARVAADLGSVDILVNNAGSVVVADAVDLELAEFERLMRLNVTAGLALSQLFARERIATQAPGAIVCIASLMSEICRPGTAAYAISKGAVKQLVKTLAVEWAPHGIRVNGIGPGYIRTPLTQRLQDDADFDRKVLADTPMGRWGEPDDLAGTCVFLASDAARFLTGQIIYVDGGWLALI